MAALTQDYFIMLDGKKYDLVYESNVYGWLDHSTYEDDIRYETGGLDALREILGHSERTCIDFLGRKFKRSYRDIDYFPPECFILEFDAICYAEEGSVHIDTKNVVRENGYFVFKLNRIDGHLYVSESIAEEGYEQAQQIMDIIYDDSEPDDIYEEYYYDSSRVDFYATKEAYLEMVDYLKTVVEKINEHYKSTGERTIFWKNQ